MLQRPRDLLTSYDQYSASSVSYRPRYPYHYKQYDPYHKPVEKVQPVRNCHINAFNSLETNWNATKAKLVFQWGKIQARNQRRIKRSMVKNSTTLRNCIIKTQVPGPTSAGDSHNSEATSVACSDRAQASDSLVAETDSVDGDSKQCLFDFNVCTEELNIQNDGYKPGDLSHKKRRSADPMESDRKAGAARRPSHCQRDYDGKRALTPDQYVAIKKQEAIALVMAKFNQWFNKRLEIISWLYVTSSHIMHFFSKYAYEASEASGNPSGCSGGASSGNINSGQGQSGRSTRSKRRLGGDDQDGSSAGGDEGDPNRGGSKRAKKEEAEAEKKFACPFYKHDPRAHNKHRSCAGPGWPSLHRVKEHLYRAHRLPKHTCPRCNEPFEDAKDLSEHLRAEELCEKLDIVPALQGIDEATEAKLKVRKKNGLGMTDEQRWCEIYMILFPKANPNAMPTPYCDSNDALRCSKSIEEWKKTKKRMQKDLPKSVQKKVEKSFEKVEVDVLNRLPDIVRDCLFEFFKDSSHDDRSSSTTTPAATPRAHTPSIPAAREQPALATEEIKDTSLDISYFLEPAMMGGPEDFDFFDFGSTDCGFFDKESDSGYASTSTGRGVTAEAEY
ncbi:uncharacterized protein GGS22DRAFT_191224 [Annulohypoxylon maeteangense]|uniref:uncharacterized protein n=1 Tax=Annulohypoxylon maeteangense TaxID=1927788 RepID=UPI002007AE38|nr:uncharacterized protein GGS22DRAFT_191224 [Annulohypoxylon maeteangense]KAI0882634.1 hypothetical protein GGS22DRAFT_191224 [Annulohypoxylon maeteangense]